MIIKALTIENFKGIREPVRIEFKPITLLFGPNSAGKGDSQHIVYRNMVGIDFPFMVRQAHHERK